VVLLVAVGIIGRQWWNAHQLRRNTQIHSLRVSFRGWLEARLPFLRGRKSSAETLLIAFNITYLLSTTYYM
jgi:hypothetical protein